MSTLEDTNSNWIVYRHISPSGKIYIGITSKSPKQRWGSNGYGYKNCSIFEKAIKKYGWDNIKHEVLFTNLTEDKAKSLEIELIRHYKGLGLSYNVTDGGDGALGRHPSVETREKMRALKLGKPLSEEHRQKLRLSAKKLKGIPRSEDIKRRLHEANKGKKPAPQTIEAVKKYNKEHPLTPERLKKMIEASRKAGHASQAAALNRNRTQIGIKHRKAIVQFSLSGEYIRTFDCALFAERETSISNSSISKCCKGKAYKAGNFLWMYKVDYDNYRKEGTFQSIIEAVVKKAAEKSGHYIRTDEWRKRKSEQQRGKDKRSDATKRYMQQRSSEMRRKPVAMLSLNGTMLTVFESATKAAMSLGRKNGSGHIGTCCNGKREQVYGYKWRYITKDEYEKYKTKLVA